MKKIFTTAIALIFIFFSLHAQDIPKQTILLGGTLGFSHMKQTVTNIAPVSTPSFLISPTAGKFYRNNRVAGVSLSIGGSRQSDDFNTYSSVGAGLFLRQYLPLGKSFYVFAEEGLSFQHFKQDVGLGTPQSFRTSIRRNSAGVYFNPGLAYSVTKHFQLELALNRLAELGYFSDKSSGNDGTLTTHTDTRSFSIATGIADSSLGAINFGVRWLL